MGDVICKWRVASHNNLKEIVTWLPKEKMPNKAYRKLMSDDFLKTGYQLACQLGLYYIDNDDYYIPRFDHDLTDDEAKEYLHNWILRYYAPNPYTPSIGDEFKTPINIVQTLIDYIENNKGHNYRIIFTKIFGEDAGKTERLKSAINNYSRVLFIDKNDDITLQPNYKEIMNHLNVDRNDSQAFFKNFNDDIEFSSETLADIKKYTTLLKENYNLVLTGAPGTGKTFLAKQIAATLISGGTKDWDSLTSEEKTQVGFVQFHPSYDYTDFVEGLRPNSDCSFSRQDGLFKDFCKKALSKNVTVEHKDNNFIFNFNNDDNLPPYVFIIDEINRGELSKILGELFYAIEPNYRGEKGRVITQYNKMVEDDDVFRDGFYIPKNVYIIGTMNDVDRGVEAMDFAIRRRFAWREVTAAKSAERMGITGLTLAKMEAMNNALVKHGLTEAHCIGGAYFLKLNGSNNYDQLWANHLKGIVTEYFRGEPDASTKIKEIETIFKQTQLPNLDPEDKKSVDTLEA